MAFIQACHADERLKWPRILKKHSEGNGNEYKDLARIAELERLLGQESAEIELLKKAFAMTQKIH